MFETLSTVMASTLCCIRISFIGKACETHTTNILFFCLPVNLIIQQMEQGKKKVNKGKSNQFYLYISQIIVYIYFIPSKSSLRMSWVWLVEVYNCEVRLYLIRMDHLKWRSCGIVCETGKTWGAHIIFNNFRCACFFRKAVNI